MTDVDPSTPGQPTPTSASAPALTADDLVRLTGGRAPRPIRPTHPRRRRRLAAGRARARCSWRCRASGPTATPTWPTRSPGERRRSSSRGPIGDPGALGDVTVVRVADPLAALGAVAAGWRRRFDPLVVGVTGSIAKTSTKEAVAAVLSRRFRTLAQRGQPEQRGRPAADASCVSGRSTRRPSSRWGCTSAARSPTWRAIARPRIGVVTAVQAVHLSRIGSLEAIEAAKGELLEALPPTARRSSTPTTRSSGGWATGRRRAAVSYGFAADADVGAEAVESLGLDGMRFALRAGGQRRPVTIPALGRLSVHNALAGGRGRPGRRA